MIMAIIDSIDSRAKPNLAEYQLQGAAAENAFGQRAAGDDIQTCCA
jgi:hypothetical protein